MSIKLRHKILSNVQHTVYEEWSYGACICKKDLKINVLKIMVYNAIKNENVTKVFRNRTEIYNAAKKGNITKLGVFCGV